MKDELKVDDILVYWESKRIRFNLIQLIVGVLFFALSESLFISSFPMVLASAVIYAIAINIIYTLGCYLNMWVVTMLESEVRIWHIYFYALVIFATFITGLAAWTSLYMLTPF